MRVGPDGPSEVNCNGHVDVEQSQSHWRDEDQHNGNAGLTEKCASQEEQHREFPGLSICNGVDTEDYQELDTEIEGRGAHCSGVSERHLPAGLEDGELEQSLCQEDGEDGPNYQYRTEESLRNGKSAKL